MPFKIVLVDDHEVVLKGLQLAIRHSQDFEIAGVAVDGHESIPLCKKLSPDVVVIDVVMEPMDGIEATRRILASCPNTRVVAFSGYRDRELVIGMFRAGAKGYICKSASAKKFVECLREVCAGNVYFDPAISSIVLDALTNTPLPLEISREVSLSRRDQEFLELIAQGCSVAEISAKFGITEKSAYAMRKRLMNKLSIDTVPRLAIYALRYSFSTKNRSS